MSLSRRGGAEARAVTGVVVVLAVSVAVGAVFPDVEHVLNVVFTVIGGVALLCILGRVALDLWGP